MNTKIDFSHLGDRVVYVKPVAVADLPQEVQAQAEGLDELFAVHNADGVQLALVADRRMAFLLARQHDMSPMTVH
ncbi:hypothetical protein OG2516_17171 [Oceanicola granulosus HTCC2516]|uniref:DUF1150 family protein n=1 Tax=Oceanicola granulosus (strain ATCC BAA-861 / DSM 15982 / KCTC 12143 / HTCC2516) TaxID=314256 RepID=Q2CFK9_OCEGH|nr:DUF1150 family protein [Oceanicola granulosus]EAR51473.1 hypothetical protein OG2516_17171 [Oceanicola granulosus HTCC2516]